MAAFDLVSNNASSLFSKASFKSLIFLPVILDKSFKASKSPFIAFEICFLNQSSGNIPPVPLLSPLIPPQFCFLKIRSNNFLISASFFKVLDKD